jgi:hypothetical protein
MKRFALPLVVGLIAIVAWYVGSPRIAVDRLSTPSRACVFRRFAHASIRSVPMWSPLCYSRDRALAGASCA